MKESSHKSRNHSKNDKKHNSRDESTDKYRNVLKERLCRDDLEYDRNGKTHCSNSTKHHSDFEYDRNGKNHGSNLAKHHSDFEYDRNGKNHCSNSTKHHSDLEYDRNGKNHCSKSTKHHSDINKEKHRSSEHNSRHNHPKSVISSANKEDKKHKRSAHHDKEGDDLEELSRKKQKIVSELRAIEVEMAAEMEAEEAETKNTQRKPSSVNKRKPETSRVKEHVRAKEEHVRVKEEPVRVKEELVRVKEERVRVKEEPLSDNEGHKRSRDKTKSKSVPNDNKSKKSKPQSSKSSGEDEKWGNSSAESKKPEKPKEKPNFATSGKLAEDTNTYNGVVIKYNEPAEARKPKKRWRLYPFKGDTNLPFIPVHRQSAYLFGRTRSIADIPIDHPSCSKQHAVLQFRLVTFKREDGTTGRRVRPYIIDLESSNGTFVNNKKADPRCYVELMEKDVIKFGFSSREYVLLHEESQFDAEDEDVILESDQET